MGNETEALNQLVKYFEAFSFALAGAIADLWSSPIKWSTV